MSASYEILHSLVHQPSSIVTQQYNISQLNIGGRIRGGHRLSRGYKVIGCGCCRGHGRGVLGGCGGRIYGHNPY